MKRVKENTDYVKNDSGSIVLDSNSKYIEYMKRREKSIQEIERVNNLESELKELKLLVGELLKKSK